MHSQYQILPTLEINNQFDHTMLVGSKKMCSPQETFEDGPTSDLLDEYFFLSQQLISIIGEQVLLYLAHKYVKLTLNPI